MRPLRDTSPFPGVTMRWWGALLYPAASQSQNFPLTLQCLVAGLALLWFQQALW